MSPKFEKSAEIFAGRLWTLVNYVSQWSNVKSMATTFGESAQATNSTHEQQSRAQFGQLRIGRMNCSEYADLKSVCLSQPRHLPADQMTSCVC
jgi:hypothetical protein